MIQMMLLVVLAGLMHAARSFTPFPSLGSGPAGTTLAAGFLLLAALLMGDLFKRCGLPKLTGYLATGMIAGPYVLGLVSATMLIDLRIFNGVAISLIALTAGTEMDVRALRPLFRGILLISLFAVVGTMGVLTVATWLLRDLLPFTGSLDGAQMLALSLVLGVTLASQSPAVVVALRRELDADGPVARTVLGVVVFADLLVIVLFAVASGYARPLLNQGVAGAMTGGSLAWEIFGSFGVGLAIGLLIVAYLRLVPGGGPLFVVITGFLAAEVGQRVDLDPLLIALFAGMLVRNFSGFGDRLHEAIDEASLPVYVAFFAVAGATIHLDVLAELGLIAGIFVLIRGASFLAGTWAGATVAGSTETVKRYAGFGLMPQAGLALALALLFARSFPALGDQASALVFGVVALNELVAPIIYRWALIRSGEAGRGARVEAEPPPEAALAPVD
jgi:Kef-type K+ transport system membrane component KefB